MFAVFRHPLTCLNSSHQNAMGKDMLGFHEGVGRENEVRSTCPVHDARSFPDVTAMEN